MTFAAFRRQSGMPLNAAAAWLGASTRQVIRWEKGESIPKPEMQRKIKRLTKGAVGAEDWLNGAARRG